MKRSYSPRKTIRHFEPKYVNAHIVQKSVISRSLERGDMRCIATVAERVVAAEMLMRK